MFDNGYKTIFSPWSDWNATKDSNKIISLHWIIIYFDDNNLVHTTWNILTIIWNQSEQITLM